MSDLTSKEQRSVRTTLLFLRVRAGGSWSPVAKALHVEEDTIAKVVYGASSGSPFPRGVSRVELRTTLAPSECHELTQVARHCSARAQQLHPRETTHSKRPRYGSRKFLRDFAVAAKLIDDAIELRILGNEWARKLERVAAVADVDRPSTCDRGGSASRSTHVGPPTRPASVGLTSPGSIMRFDRAQPIGAARPALDVLPWKLSDEAIDLVDEWLTWYMRRQLPEDGTLHQFRQIV